MRCHFGPDARPIIAVAQEKGLGFTSPGTLQKTVEEGPVMTETQFRQLLRKKGFETPQVKDYVPQAHGDMHIHEFDVMLLVQEGPFTLATETGETTYQAAETCELRAGVLHIERTGADGARVLLGKKARTS
jgi:quercetin dioxygenase-like cupin family protein